MVEIRGGRVDAHGLYHGRPTQYKIDLLKFLTITDSNGFRYWRKNAHDGWRRQTVAHVQALNDAINLLLEVD
jgi:hypothetical protein